MLREYNSVMVLFKFVITVISIIVLLLFQKEAFSQPLTYISFVWMFLVWVDQINDTFISKNNQKRIDIMKIMNAAFEVSVTANGIGFASGQRAGMPNFDAKISELDEINEKLISQLDNSTLKSRKDLLDKWQMAISKIQALKIMVNHRIVEKKIKSEMGKTTIESQEEYIKFHNDFFRVLIEASSLAFDVYHKLAGIKIPSK